MYGCESWTVNAADRNRLNAFEMDMYISVMRISWTEHRTNNSVLEELKPACRLLAEVRRRKLQYFGHVVRADNLCTHVLHSIIAGIRRRGYRAETFDGRYQAMHRSTGGRLQTVFCHWTQSATGVLKRSEIYCWLPIWSHIRGINFSQNVWPRRTCKRQSRFFSQTWVEIVYSFIVFCVCGHVNCH